MTTGLWLQQVIIALAVLTSVLVALRKLAPKLTSRCLASVVMRLNTPGRSRPVAMLGRWLQPRQGTGQCGDGCSTCGACGSKPAVGEVQPLVFHPRGK